MSELSEGMNVVGAGIKPDVEGATYQRWITPDFADNRARLETEQALRAEQLEDLGYQEGVQKGLEAGLEQGRQAFQEQAESLRSILEHLFDALTEIDQQLMQELAGLSGHIAKGLVQRELESHPDLIATLVEDAIKVFHHRTRDFDIRLNPIDAKVLREYLYTEPVREGYSWNLVEDLTMERGDCQVSSGHSTITATLDARIQAVLEQALTNKPEPAPGESTS